MSENNFTFLPKIVNGGIAGIVGVTCVFPIDLCKTRLQGQSSTAPLYTGMLDCMKKTFKADGYFGLYRGSAVNIVLITPEKAIKLVGNDLFRHHLKPANGPITPIREMVAGACAGACQVIVTTPMELLKVQGQWAGTHKKDGPKPGALSLAANLIRQKGIAGLYQGIGATLARDVTFSAIYFPLFANINALGPRREGSQEAVFYWSFISGLSSGAFASWIVTPLDVVKTRLQIIDAEAPRYKGIADCFLKTLRNEGLAALFKGAGCRVMVMAPLFGIAQTVYYLGVAEYLFGYPRK